MKVVEGSLRRGDAEGQRRVGHHRRIVESQLSAVVVLSTSTRWGQFISGHDDRRRFFTERRPFVGPFDSACGRVIQTPSWRCHNWRCHSFGGVAVTRVGLDAALACVLFAANAGSIGDIRSLAVVGH